ncbi:hypothetical protein SAMN05192588_0091 [Nonlabens sp. Hel1_33_55]|uniref:DUF7467 domain-containing protein n=1 Tax=Nonlabens sp. Hel1_33_55 TaxID=1336802 RepID=UPI000875B8E0|nr:CHRD domain-containing protein [Nonlabens sp. Hel1_33_55]SCX88432.1 hypothetical protein SAMN05192588_0091 [Nonlabens sp. Hel1_33_55]
MKNFTKIISLGLLAMILACSPEPLDEFEEISQPQENNLEFGAKNAKQSKIEGIRVTYKLREADVPGVSGFITIRDAGVKGVEAFIKLKNTTPGLMHPVHIHEGVFGSEGPRAKTLNPVNGSSGISKTYFTHMDNGDVADFDELVNQREYYVGPHFSMEDMETLLAVGNIGVLDPPVECSDCDGGLDRLAFQYNGDKTARVSVKQSNGQVIFQQDLDPEEQFTITGTGHDNTFGDKIYIYVNHHKVAKIHTDCEESVLVGDTFDDFEVVDGNSVLGGPICDAPEEEPEPECSDCDGKVNYLSLKYTGKHGAKVTIKQSQDHKYVYHGYVKPGEVIKINGRAHDGSFGKELKTYINFICKDDIDTSCDEAIGPGSKFGYLTVVEGTSTEGGELCEVTEDDEDDENECDIKEWWHKHSSKCKKDKKTYCGNYGWWHKHSSKCYKKAKKCKIKSRWHKHSYRCK